MDRLSSQCDKQMLNEIQTFVDEASCKGLRTLLVAMRLLDKEELAKFEFDVAQADNNIENRDTELEKVFDAFERDLILLGATAVEDRLQDKVPETIFDLQRAGIKIWMLTGDKFETAENIGFSCKLIGPEFQIYKMQGPDDVDSICSVETLNQNSHLM